MEAKVKKPVQPVREEEKPMLTKVAGQLLKTQQELDELAVQFALGKAEAKDKFEEVKKEFRTQVGILKQSLGAYLLKELVNSTRSKFEALEVQLALGKAESAEVFEAQSKRILRSVRALEKEIRDTLPSPEVTTFRHEMEKFKLKIEILRLKYFLKKFEMKDSFKEKMVEARKTIDHLKLAAKGKLSSGKERWGDAKDEVQLAYKHLRQALKSLTTKK